MELRHLRYFVAVAEEENVSQAAERLHISQPPLSRQIRDLEDELNVVLFMRGANSLQLTHAGRVFLTEARAVLDRAEEAVRVVQAMTNGEQGEIHIGYAPSLTAEFLPHLLRNYASSHPGIQVKLHDLSSEGMLSGLRSGDLDLALLVQVSNCTPAGIVFEALRHHAACVALPLAHSLTASAEISLAQISKEPLVAFTLRDYPEHHAWIRELFAEFPNQPSVIEEHESVSSLIAAVGSGKGIALVTEGFEQLSGACLTIKPITPPPPLLAIGIARRDKSLSPAIEGFIAVAKKVTQPER